jgi:hypothetical protein
LAVPDFPASATPPTAAQQSPSLQVTRDQRLSRFDQARFNWLSSPIGLGILQVLAALLTVVPLLLIPVANGNSGMMNIVESTGALDRVALWQQTFGRLFGDPLFAGWSAFHPVAVVGCFSLGLVSMFVLHGLAFRGAWTGRSVPLRQWLIGPVATHIVMIAMVPSNADVFYYEMSGNLANEGFNPYLHELVEFPANPLLPYNHWVDMATVYGPFWTRLNQLVIGMTGPDPVVATIVYKVILGIMVLALAGAIFFIARRLTGNSSLATAAFVLVAWQPNLILESSGQAHSDPAMLLLSTLGMMLVFRGGQAGIRGAIVIVTVSAMIKYVTLPLVGMLGLLRLFVRQPVSNLLRSWILDSLAIAAVITASFLPFWGGPETLQEMFTEPGRLFSHPFWQLQSVAIKGAFSTEGKEVYESVIRIVMQIATLVGLGYALWIVIEAARSDPGKAGSPARQAWTHAILKSWAIILAVLAFVPVNSHAWYWTWPVVPISLLIAFEASREGRLAITPVMRLPRWFWPYMALTATLTLIYHARIIRL